MQYCARRRNSSNHRSSKLIDYSNTTECVYNHSGDQFKSLCFISLALKIIGRSGVRSLHEIVVTRSLIPRSHTNDPSSCASRRSFAQDTQFNRPYIIGLRYHQVYDKCDWNNLNTRPTELAPHGWRIRDLNLATKKATDFIQMFVESIN